MVLVSIMIVIVIVLLSSEGRSKIALSGYVLLCMWGSMLKWISCSICLEWLFLLFVFMSTILLMG